MQNHASLMTTKPGNARVRIVYRRVWIIVVHLQHATWTEDF